MPRLIGVVLLSCLAVTPALLAGDRLYDGDPRPRNEVAIITTLALGGAECGVVALSAEGGFSRTLPTAKRWIEVLPGKYAASIGCARLNWYTGDLTGGRAVLSVDVLPDHVYRIEIGKERAVVVDLATAADFEKAKDGKHLQRAVDSYFKGKRAPARETTYNGVPTGAWK